MHISEIDNIAINTLSPIHERGAVSKLLLSVFLLLSFIISHSLFVMLALIITIVLVLKLARLPVISLIHYSIYPAFFSLFFAFVVASELSMVLVLILRAVGAALSMILLITTTPYLEVFAILSLFLPSLIIDILMITYRTFFIVLEKLSNLMRIIKLRGGFSPWTLAKNIKNIALLIGNLIVQSFEMSERMYKILRLRGYNDKIHIDKPLGVKGIFDILYVLIGAVIFILVVTI